MIIDSLLHPHFDGLKKMLKIYLSKTLLMYVKKFYEKILGNTPQHATAKNIQINFPKFGRVFKFCVVEIHMIKFTLTTYGSLETKKILKLFILLGRFDFKEEQIQRINILHPNNWEIYTIDNKPVMDFIINFEQLDRDLRFVLEKLNIKTNIHLPFTKVNTNKKVSYSDLINLENKKKIQKLFGKEIEYFKFELN